MNYDELLKYIGLFREKIEQGKLVLFVRAGVSQNTGIVSIQYIKAHKMISFSVGKFSENALLRDKLYDCYILNKYDEIQILIDSDCGAF